MMWESKLEAAKDVISKPLQNAAANQPGLSSFGGQVFSIQTEASSIRSCPEMVNRDAILFSSAHVGKNHISSGNRIIDVLLAVRCRHEACFKCRRSKVNALL